MPPKTAESEAVSSKKQPGRKISGRKPAVKQSLPPAERLKRLFTSLCAQIDGGHLSNAIKTCDKILRLEPNDHDALQTKLFLLLQKEQYDTALALINSLEGATKYSFEKAYSLYRLHRESEAEAILADIKAGNEAEDDSRGITHLEAQLRYRQGTYQIAFDLYNELLNTSEVQSEEHSDILINLQAAQKHLDFITTDFLRSLDALPTLVTSNLESNPPPSQPISSAALISSNTEEGDGTAVKPQRKVRKSRVPAGIIPGVTPPPDPERWLKKSERSTFGHGNRKRKGPGGGGGATQGSVESTATPQSLQSHGVKSVGKGKKKK